MATPEVVLDEQAMVIVGIAEGAQARSADGRASGYAGSYMDGRSAAEIAQAGGLPMPSGWTGG